MRHTEIAVEGDPSGELIILVARGDLSSEFTIPVTAAGGTAERKCMHSKGIYKLFSYIYISVYIRVLMCA